MLRGRGERVYMLYRALSYGLSPLIHLHLRWRKLLGLEHPLRWRERLGRPSLPRPPGPLVWFHAVSLGEGMAAIPVIKQCVLRRPDVNVLMTTTTASAFEVLKNLLPSSVIYQFAPLDTPVAMDAFLGFWKPNAIFLMESELWPNLVMRSSQKAIEDIDDSSGNMSDMEDMRVQFAHRQVWMASSIHRGEEEVMLGVHKVLREMHHDIVTIIVPRHPQHGQEIALELQKEGIAVALRSRHDKLMPDTDIYVVDTLGELRKFYRLTPIAVIGGSFLPGSAGHNVSEAAAAGCAVLSGHHTGHFSHMVREMQRLNPLSVLQISGKLELEAALSKLFSNAGLLAKHQLAAKQAFHALSDGVVENIWNLTDVHVFSKVAANMKAGMQQDQT